MRRVFAIALLCLCLAHVALAQCTQIKQADRKQYAEALAHYNSHNFRQAGVLLRKVAAHNPKCAEPQFWLGMVSVNDGFNTTGIRRYFAQCIALEPDYPHPLAHYYMALVHYTDGHYADAVASLGKYFSLADANADNRDVMAVYEEASNYLYWAQFLADAELNAAPFNPHTVPGVSSTHDEMLPYLSPDGTEFYYLRRIPVKKKPTYYASETEEFVWRLLVSNATDEGFTAGTALPAPFNSGKPEGGVSLTADGSELYYSVITNDRGYANSDIYCVKRRAGQWSAPELLGKQVNAADSWESQPTISADGQVLIFASNRAGGLGGTDLWRCHRLRNGDWSRAENLGANINTAGNEKMPFLATDGHTLYFLSDGWQGFGGYDVYFADLNDRHGNRPTNLGLPINTEADEGGFGVTTDGTRAYFVGRTDDSRSADVLMFDLYPAARPEPMQVCRITVVGNTTADTVLMLPTKRAAVVTIAQPGLLPAIFYLKAKQMPDHVNLSDSVMHPALQHNAVVDALAAWLIANPRVRIAVECPTRAEADAIVDRLRGQGVRAERLKADGGTAFKKPQIRML